MTRLCLREPNVGHLNPSVALRLIPIILFNHHNHIQGEEPTVDVPTFGASTMVKCINLASSHGQRTRKKIVTGHFYRFLGIGEVRCPKDFKNGLLERWRALYFPKAKNMVG